MISDRIEVVKGDLTEQKVDAIVNAANSDLILGGGVAGAIRVKGGDLIQTECDRQSPIELGQAALTTAGELPAKHVIHAAVMHLGGSPTQESIENSTFNSLILAAEYKLESVSFPALGTGIGGFSMSLSAEIMLNAAKRFLRGNSLPKVVSFVLFDDSAYNIFLTKFNEIVF